MHHLDMLWDDRVVIRMTCQNVPTLLKLFLISDHLQKTVKPRIWRFLNFWICKKSFGFEKRAWREQQFSFVMQFLALHRVFNRSREALIEIRLCLVDAPFVYVFISFMICQKWEMRKRNHFCLCSRVLVEIFRVLVNAPELSKV